MQSNGLDWKSLLKQKPASVVKRSGGLWPRQQTPATPAAQHATSSSKAEPELEQQTVVPFLLLPVAFPQPPKQKIPSSEPASDLLRKLAQLKQKAASLVDASASTKTSGTTPSFTQILPEPLLPPEHVQSSSYFWFDSEDDGQESSSSGWSGEARSEEAEHHRRSSSSTAGPSAGRGGRSSQHVHQSSSQQHRAAGAAGGGDSMATSLTGQTGGSSLLTTAHSPNQQWAQALARIKQLQRHTEEVLQQGHGDDGTKEDWEVEASTA